MSPLLRLVLLLLLAAGEASMAAGEPRGRCAKNTSLAGFEADLTMSQHQLRGRVAVVDGCSFRVSGLDLLAGSPAARWWRAASPDLLNLSLGSPASPSPLNRTFLSETLTFHLLPGLSWLDVPVLAAFDPLTASLFGLVTLANSSTSSPSPTTFDSCAELSSRYRVRWSLNHSANSIDIGLEAAVGSEYYMAFGWAAPGAAEPSMIGADVAVVGFTEAGVPFAEDYYITQYSECLLRKDGMVEGVCPDTMYEGTDPAGLVNNTRLVYGHRRDGVSFVRVTRPLVSVDRKYDVPVNATRNMTVIWALGLMRPPDSLRPYYLPQNHGGPKGAAFGFVTLNVSDISNGCLGPLDAEDKEDQDRITAERKTPLIVTSGPAMHYPNPPNPSKVIYINKKEAPLLKVERGVPMTFSIEAGHDVALYITSDPVGGNATSRNITEVIYAGGPEAEGVPATPTELVWLPDRNTPDQVFYQSLYEEKMGWKIQVVDGGLSDMYNNSVMLDDQQVTFFWTLSGDSINIAARGEKKSGYLAVGFGSAMVNSYAYVGWVDGNGTGHVNSYWIDGKDGMSVHQTYENLTYVRCRSENGVITFEFTRPLSPSCSGRVECKNIIDPTTPLKVIWAMGAQWSAGSLNERNMHSVTSSHPVRVLLLRGSAEAEQDLRPVLAVHGFMMFVAWGFLLPGGILAARYLKHLKGDVWFQTHVYLQYSGIAIMFLGVLFAAAELRGFYFKSAHVKIGVMALAFACSQPINAYLRPQRPDNGEIQSAKGMVWEYLHIFSGRSAVIAGTVSLFTGMQHLGHRYGSKNVKGLTWGLILWVLAGVLLVVYLEYMEVKRRRSNSNGLPGVWVIGNTEEDDSVDLLQTDRDVSKPVSDSSGIMEVQLQSLNR